MEKGGTILRFALVGTGVAALYILLYLALIAMGLGNLPANAIAFLTAVAVQYLGQAGFTFKASLRDPHQALRFAVMIGFGLMTSALITGLIGPALGWAAFVSAAIVTLVDARPCLKGRSCGNDDPAMDCSED